MTLNECRIEIDKIDKQLLELLEKRFEIAKEVAVNKKQQGITEVYVPEREEQLYEQAKAFLKDNEAGQFATDIYREIIATSKELQHKLLNPGKKCIFLDLDGTLLNDDKQVCERNRIAIERCLAQGNKIIIASGRPLESAIIGAQKMDLAKQGCYIASYNGGILYDCTTKKCIFDKALDMDVTKYLFEEARNAGLHIQAYCEGKVWCEEDNEEVRYYCKKGQLPYEVHKDVPAELTSLTNKVLLISFEDGKLSEFQKQHAQWEYGKVQSVFSTREFLEYSPTGVSKGNAVEILANLLGFKIEDTIAIGDEQNDISMILKAGLGVCMANGLDSIKQIADYVTIADNNEGGVGEVIERFVFGEDR